MCANSLHVSSVTKQSSKLTAYNHFTASRVYFLPVGFTEMVAENKGVTIICRPLVEKLYSGRVVCVPLKKPEFPWTLGLIAKKNRSLPGAAKSLWDFCAKV